MGRAKITLGNHSETPLPLGDYVICEWPLNWFGIWPFIHILRNQFITVAVLGGLYLDSPPWLKSFCAWKKYLGIFNPPTFGGHIAYENDDDEMLKFIFFVAKFWRNISLHWSLSYFNVWFLRYFNLPESEIGVFGLNQQLLKFWLVGVFFCQPNIIFSVYCFWGFESREVLEASQWSISLVRAPPTSFDLIFNFLLIYLTCCIVYVSVVLVKI